ncbi:PREDICTED: ras GTPase-activating protein 1-like, partial [Nipponia nippon]|uniref:ras GTPase-activating protein 1-like n=1 Tax=Nipponia nippon TaxID=128390 RepID=UPI000510C7AF
MGEEDISFFNCWDNCWYSFSTAEMQAHREEARFSSSSRRWLANLSTIGASVCLQLVIARVLAYDISALCINFCHMDRVHQISSGSLDTWLLSSFLKGDMFIVHNELEDGWMWVTNLRTDEQGLIVEDLVEEVGREEDPHEGKIWFHGKISKQEAYNLLMTVGQVCGFLVRPSDNTPGDYSLYFRTSENIQRFKICPTSSNQFMMGGRYYNSIAEIIEHYRKEQIVEGYYLKDPVPMQHQEQVLNDTVDGKEIYNTIRRKTKDAFYKNIVKKGYLLKKSKGKRWKNLYFILEGNDAQLIYFESEKRATKPKGLIDLSVCSVYGVHDSLFGRPNCFQIVVQHFSEEHYIFYFAGETPEQAQVRAFVESKRTTDGGYVYISKYYYAIVADL